MIIIFFLITVVCLVPFGISFFYLIAGIRLMAIGRKEKSNYKTISGLSTVFLSIVSIGVVYFLWQWLSRSLLAWEL